MGIFNFYKTESCVNIKGFYTAFCLEHPYGYTFDGEAHNFWEMMYIAEGEATVSADERIYRLGEGELIFHKPMEFHKFTNSGNGKLKIFVISFSADGASVGWFENGVFVLTREQRYAITQLADYVFNCCGEGRSSSRYSLFSDGDCTAEQISILKNMLELFLLHSIKTAYVRKSALSTAEAVVFRNAVNVMQGNIYDSLSNADIADACNVSISYLKKIFAKYTGIGIHEYYLNLKITEATALLKRGCSVTETAEELCFSSQNYFNTVYKRVTGISPGKHKNMLSS